MGGTRVGVSSDLTRQHLRDLESRLMARLDIPDGPGLERERLLGMRLDIAQGMGAYAAAVYRATELAPREREVARLRIAAANDCPVCLNSRSVRAAEAGFGERAVEQVVSCPTGATHTIADLTRREHLAGEFADRFAHAHHSIDDEFMVTMRDAFTDPELIELAALCAMTLGNGRFLTVLGVAADDDGHLYLPEPPLGS